MSVRLPWKPATAPIPGNCTSRTKPAVLREDPHLRLDILEVTGDELVVDETGLNQRLLALGNDFLPILPLWFAEVDRHQPPPWSVDVRLKVQHPPVVARQRVLVLEVVDQFDWLRVGLGKVLDRDPVPLIGSQVRGDNQPAAVVGDLRLILPFPMLRPKVNPGIGRLRRAEAMVEHLVVEVEGLELRPFLRLLVTAVEKTLTILGPGCLGELGPAKLVGQHLAGGDFQDVPGGPVGAGFGAAVSHVAAIVAETQPAQRDRAVLGPSVGVEQRAGRGIQRVQYVEHRLVLQAVVLQVVVASARLETHRILGKVPKVRQPAADFFTLRDRRQVLESHLVLSRHPIGNFLRVANVFLQPAIRITHLDAEIGIGVVHAAGRGICGLFAARTRLLAVDRGGNRAGNSDHQESEQQAVSLHR